MKPETIQLSLPSDLVPALIDALDEAVLRLVETAGERYWINDLKSLAVALRVLRAQQLSGAAKSSAKDRTSEEVLQTYCLLNRVRMVYSLAQLQACEQQRTEP